MSLVLRKQDRPAIIRLLAYFVAAVLTASFIKVGLAEISGE